MDAWQTVLLSITGNTLVIGALGFFGKSLITQLLQRDIKRFEIDLQKSYYEHQVRFGHIHEKRALIIADLYKMIVGISDLVRKYIIRMTSDEKGFNEISYNIDKLRLFFESHKIYFESSLSDKIDEFIKILWEPSVYVHAYGNLDNPHLIKEKNEKLQKAIETIDKNGVLVKVTEELANDFRRLIGVEIE